MEEKQKSDKSKIKNINREIAPEPTLKAPPPSPCTSLKQRSGSVPDVRIAELKKEKTIYSGICHRNHLSHALIQSIQKTIYEPEGKKSTSDHGMVNVSGRIGPWTVACMGPCTSKLLHSVRQRLMNL